MQFRQIYRSGESFLHIIIILMCCACFPYASSDLGYSLTRGDEYRICYMFAHANILHLAMNILTYFCLSRNLTGTVYSPLCVFIGWLATFGTETTEPTIGLSAVCYAQIGVLTAYFWNKQWCIMLLASSVIVNAIGFAMESMNIYLHTLSFVYALFATIILKRFV